MIAAFSSICRPWPIVLLVCSIGPAALADEQNAVQTAAASITAAELKQHVAHLADDLFEGREAGTRGGRAAGLYIVEQLKKYGLKPAGPSGSFYQPFGAGYTNILARLEGSDPELKRQVIIVSAHFDHVGYGTPRNSYGPTGFIHNGADDNASGVAGLLEVAEALSKLQEHPRRTILIAFWDGEEKGLLGSKHWVERPTAPLADVKLMVNMDMIGRLRGGRLEICGTRSAAGLRRLISQENLGQLVLDFTWEMKENSDHYSFYARQMPVLLLHTGLHDDYHRPSDDVEKINPQGMQAVSQLLFRVLVRAADAARLGGFRPASHNENPWTQRILDLPLAPLPGRLGIVWDPKGEKQGKIVLTSVTPQSAAAKAGLGPGDRIVSFAGQTIETANQLRILSWAVDAATRIGVERSGMKEPLDLEIKLSGKPSRLGIGWRVDDAEPGAIILNRVTPGTPAGLAGLRVGDRIYQAAGQSFDNPEQFRQLANSASGKLELQVENYGRVRTVSLELAETSREAPPPTTPATSPAAAP